MEVDNFQWLNVLSKYGEFSGFWMTTNKMASKSSCLLLNGGGGLRKTMNQISLMEYVFDSGSLVPTQLT